MKPSLTKARIKLLLNMVRKEIAKEELEVARRRVEQIESMSRGRPFQFTPALRDLRATYVWLENQLDKREGYVK
jgi:RNase P subunit RPR2